MIYPSCPRDRRYLDHIGAVHGVVKTQRWWVGLLVTDPGCRFRG
ncbi:hypothetical protein HMPREF9588_01223 [Cutibacterium acnes HL025PA2]|nr:hypothetical protein HMPREF9588_01223 [Cutibacterium acnes HL025PA2]